jgi:acyl dehydratase
MATVFESPKDLLNAAGAELGTTDWIEVTQDRINQFADATGDHQWIHVDVERAKQGPFGAPIAHGYLTLSLVSMLLPQIIVVKGIAMGINYGCDKVRFPSPVPVGSRIRAVGKLVGAEQKGEQIQSKVEVTIEVEGGKKPACVVETLSRYVPA